MNENIKRLIWKTRKGETYIDPEKCRCRVGPVGHQWHPHQCYYRGVVTIDGYKFCRQHTKMIVKMLAKMAKSKT